MKPIHTDILKAWHCIEFFQPYPLQKNKNSIQVYLNEAVNQGDNLLPWLSQSAARKARIPHGFVASYCLYFAVFNKNEITRMAKEHLPQFNKFSNTDKQTIDEYLRDEGKTCFAKLTLNEYGTPNFSDFSISTLPWALGKLKNNQLEQLTQKKYNDDLDKLKEAMRRIQSGLKPHPDSQEHQTLSASDIILIAKQLCLWSGFRPKALSNDPDKFILYQLDCKPFKPKKKKIQEKPNLKLNTITQEKNTKQALSTSQNLPQKEESDPTINTVEMPILNSFYMDDLEKVINSLQKNTASQNIKQYLTIKKEKHSDLYTEDGLDFIKEIIAPKRLPQGRWPSDPSHNMSLMQQFAINTAILQNNQNGILSVNGPPGTGKTTLIKDIIAHLITERAKILASHKSVEDTFDNQGYLKDALQGFETLVVSSNNAAIKNISEDLPLRSSIHESFGEPSYLKKIAEFMVAEEENKDNSDKYKRYYKPLADHETRWGLITSTLGKSYNKQHFNKRVFFNKAYQYPAGKDDEKLNHPDFLSLWQWHKEAKPISFKEAQKAFNAKIKLLNKHIDKLDNYNNLKTSCNALKEKIANQYDLPLLLKSSTENETLSQLQKTEELATIDLNIALARIESIKISPPNIIHRFFNTKTLKKHLEKLTLAIELSSDIYKKIKSLKELKETINQIIVIQKQYPDMRTPKNDDSIYDASLQKSGYWQNKAINRLRSEIFIEALNLHQSWLHQALKIDRFRQSILKIPYALNNTIKKEQAKHIWQLLFMITPVVTSTFASVANMLQHIKQDELGWLFIDEAGQALPQAAIGSIHRCKRTLAVGDPLQIEPVLTTPPSIINKICNDHLSEKSEEWNPLHTSVQQAIDRASSYGCTLEIKNTPTWIGIPLWVHRRCIEPMFSISNQIAYNSRMIHALDAKAIEPQLLNQQCQNAWINSTGNCNDKQFKPELIDDLLALLNIITATGADLSTIYIITPFKAVLKHLNKNIKQPALKNNLGTIHTFQGKENNTVILVLGCCPQNAGGASWAANTPNILNVALTRAKKNFFILGDLSVWSDKPYFSNLSSNIPNYQSIDAYKCSLDNTSRYTL